jgi:hypothetical protein
MRLVVLTLFLPQLHSSMDLGSYVSYLDKCYLSILLVEGPRLFFPL